MVGSIVAKSSGRAMAIRTNEQHRGDGNRRRGRFVIDPKDAAEQHINVGSAVAAAAVGGVDVKNSTPSPSIQAKNEPMATSWRPAADGAEGQSGHDGDGESPARGSNAGHSAAIAPV